MGENFLDGLEDYLGTNPKIKPAGTVTRAAPKNTTEDRHPCRECAGTGIYQGHRVHQTETKCFACKGKGWFKMSYADRLKARQQRQNRKARVLTEAQEGFNEEYPGLIDALRKMSTWHDFARSLIEGFDQYGSLTERQTTAALKTVEKQKAREKERTKERSQKSYDVSVEAINKLFETAQNNGLKKPRFITERLTISLAPSHGKNAGALYVKCDGEYAGKIINGEFKPSYRVPKDIMDLLREVAASPVEVATKYGKDTGRCSCCGRELTDPKSIAAGIGPVCQNKWGL